MKFKRPKPHNGRRRMFRPIPEYSKLLNNYHSYIVFIHYVSYHSRSCAAIAAEMTFLAARGKKKTAALYSRHAEVSLRLDLYSC